MLSETAVKKLQPRTSAYRVFDDAGIAGFGVKVTPTGVKTWFIRFRESDRERYLTLGHYPLTPLPAAREKARVVRSRLDQGLSAVDVIDPLAHNATLDALIEAWLIHQRRQGRRRTDDTERALRANVPADLMKRPANAVTSMEIRNALAVIHQRGARVQANRVRSALHTLYQWGMRADHDPARLDSPALFGISINPVTAIPRDAGAERSGERVLTWGEIRALWEADDTLVSWTARQACRLLLATGQRVNEVCQASWSEFDLVAGLWLIPAARVKNKRDHAVPLSPLARNLLNELREVYPGDWLFPARCAIHAARPWGDTALGHAVLHYCQRTDGAPFQARDLRRTFKTLATGSGISRDVLDKVQNHSWQDVASRHYDKHDYWPEKRKALDTWSTYLTGMLAGDTVVPMRQKKPSVAK